MSPFNVFCAGITIMIFFSTLEAMQKMIAFQNGKISICLKPGCTIANLANLCLLKYTDTKLNQSMESEKDLLDKMQKDIVGGPLFVFTRKTAVDETLFESQQRHDNQLLRLMLANYTHIRCLITFPLVFIRVGISIQRQVDSQLHKAKPVALKKWSHPFSASKTRLQNRELLYNKETSKKDCFGVGGFCSYSNNAFEGVGYLYDFCLRQEVRPSLTEEDFQNGSRKRKSMI